MDGPSKFSGGFALVGFFFFFFMFGALRSHGAKNITQGESLRDGETLSSSAFELGFFSPQGSKNRYLGIWYKQILPERTVVWVANRDNPLMDTSGVVTINGSNGNLMILDDRGTPIMSMFVSPSPSNSSIATLLDNGNFVLRNEAGEVVWQSFDYPTDTYLPGMTLGLEQKTGGRNWSLVSWRSSEDPARGSYFFGMDPSGTSRFMIQRDNGDIHWSSGTWNGEIFSLVPNNRISNTIYNLSFVANESGKYLTFFFFDSLLSRLVIDSSGQIRNLVWLQSAKVWNSYWTQPEDECEIYNSCGANACCNLSAPILCNCLDGFEVGFSSHQESNLSSSKGCVRRTNLACGNGSGDGFFRMEGVRFPDRSLYEGSSSSSLGIEDCESKCKRNCSCTAYAAAYSNGTGGCLFWSGELIGIRDSPPYTSDGGFATGDLFVRLGASELGINKTGSGASNDSGKKRRMRVIIPVVASVILILISFFLCYLLRWRKLKRKDRTERWEGLSFQRGTNASSANKFLDAINPRHSRTKGLYPPFFSFAIVEAATDNFSPANKLGQGGFGPVYKGKLSDGQEIAVKRLGSSSGQGLEEFRNEVTLISKLQHRNLVRLLGWCTHGEEKILIYEYMPNNSLDTFLFDEAKKSILDWGKRVRIIEGIAQGLLYLHMYSRLTVIHRDLKASNILLDESMNPKISDFGLARVFGGDQYQANTKRVVGTYGYMSPEYAMEGLFSVKSDVFSFGVLLLEVLGGKKAASFHHFDGSLNLLGYAWESWKEGRSIHLIDPMLANSSPTSELERYVHLALLCVQDRAADRPTMSDVVKMLKNKTATMVVPKQPAFSTRSIAETEKSSSKPRTYSVNGVTLSEILQGR